MPIAFIPIREAPKGEREHCPVVRPGSTSQRTALGPSLASNLRREIDPQAVPHGKHSFPYSTMRPGICGLCQSSTPAGRVLAHASGSAAPSGSSLRWTSCHFVCASQSLRRLEQPLQVATWAALSAPLAEELAPDLLQAAERRRRHARGARGLGSSRETIFVYGDSRRRGERIVLCQERS